jgi:hypothetical protein
MDYRYHIRVKGILDPSWADWFEGLVIEHAPNGDTELAGIIADQAKLIHILTRIYSLNLELISVNRENGDSGETA